MTDTISLNAYNQSESLRLINDWQAEAACLHEIKRGLVQKLLSG